MAARDASPGLQQLLLRAAGQAPAGAPQAQFALLEQRLAGQQDAARAVFTALIGAPGGGENKSDIMA
jgi:hypothetical protein